MSEQKKEKILLKSTSVWMGISNSYKAKRRGESEKKNNEMSY